MTNSPFFQRGPSLRNSPRLLPFLAVLLAGLATLLSGCREPDVMQGYVEGEYVDVATPLAGQLRELDVVKGGQAAAGDRLFLLERAFEQAAVDEAAQNVLRAENTLADLNKGQRPTEIAAIQARLREAASSLDYARIDWERKQRLFAEETISAQELDRARTEYETARQSVRRIRSELETAHLGGRTDKVAAAQAELDAARAKLAQARWNLDQKIQYAPVTGRVFDTYYDPGEWVAAGRPVVCLLPPEHVKTVFFVPEARAGLVHPGQTALVDYDGATSPVPVRVSYVADEAEYTPPVIYSSQNRAKLVFRVEAKPAPEDAHRLRPGQPVDVTLPGLTNSAPAAGREDG
jgi:HlyD family secretion protein